jgi:hypothetical protein
VDVVGDVLIGLIIPDDAFVEERLPVELET